MGSMVLAVNLHVVDDPRAFEELHQASELFSAFDPG